MTKKPTRGDVSGDNASRLKAIVGLLEDRLGVPMFDGPRDGLRVLVLTILSQNTTDLSAIKAYIRLCETFPRKENAKLFRNEKLIPRLPDGSVDPVAIRLSQAADAFFEPDWARIHTCDEKKLQDIIRPAGLPNSKGPAIQRVLGWVKEQVGEYSLEKALAGKTPTQAAEAMSSLKGVGAKTAAVTLIEAMGADLCPVDTHVHRIVNRLGLVSTGDNREKS
ncbi:MAG: endonuclease III domain-containing protein, partial [Planctomycetes bacterium]|nr:endonuclease III domain-containing protein [Planctomycetota bacterium]